MTYLTLVEWYKLCFSLHREHKYSLTEIENMIPFERDLHADMVIEALRKENKD